MHARHVKAQAGASGVNHGVVALALRPKLKVVAHQHIAHAQGLHQHLVNKGGRRHAGQGVVKRQHHAGVHPAGAQLVQLVAQGGNAGGGQIGLAVQGGKVVARVGLKRHDTTGHAAVAGFVLQQGQHGLVAAVHTVKVANGERAARGQARAC